MSIGYTVAIKEEEAMRNEAEEEEAVRMKQEQEKERRERTQTGEEEREGRSGQASRGHREREAGRQAGRDCPLSCKG
jgi:hypothetical protein